MEKTTTGRIKTINATHSPTFICALFIILTAILGLISLASTRTPLFDWSSLKMPFTMAKWIAPVCYMLLFVLLSISVCIMWLTKVDHPETKLTNLYWHLSVMTLLAIWPMFLILFKLPIVALIIIILATILMIYTTYRFTTTFVWAGILYIIATLAAIAITSYTFWVVLA